MKKGMVLAVMLMTLFGLVGCGSSEREELISKVVGELNTASNSLATIKENVEKWEKEKKDNEKARFLKVAVDTTEVFKESGYRLQGIKQKADQMEPSTTEQIEEFRKVYREKLGAAIERLAKEQEALKQALVRAEKINLTAIAELKQKLQMSQGEFEVLTKQR